MDISKLPYRDFVIHRKLADTRLRYIIPARGTAKFLTTGEFEMWDRLNERTRDCYQELFNEMLDKHIRKSVDTRLYISTINPYFNFKPFFESDTFIYSPKPPLSVCFRDYFIKGVTNEQT